MNTLKSVLLWPMAAIYLVAGVMHFTHAELFVQIVPPLLPAPLVLVWITGVMEVALGACVIAPELRVRAAWGIIGLLLLVFPANVYMWWSDVPLNLPAGWDQPTPEERLWRLPMQAVLIAWAWWYTRDDPRAEAPPPVHSALAN
jgi:uncharacterized membrane protein